MTLLSDKHAIYNVTSVQNELHQRRDMKRLFYFQARFKKQITNLVLQSLFGFEPFLLAV